MEILAFTIATLDTLAIIGIIYNIKSQGQTNWQIIKEYRKRGFFV